MRPRILAGLLVGAAAATSALVWTAPRDPPAPEPDAAEAVRVEQTALAEAIRSRRRRRADPEPPPPEVADPEPPELEETVPVEEGVQTEELETGPEALRIRLVDPETGESASMSVRLWRLDAPETDVFTQGDYLCRSLSVPTEGVTVEELPAGRYRLQCDGQRKTAEDPPAFEVRGGVTEFTARVQLPRTFPARVVVFDEEGARITRGTLELRVKSTSTSSSRTPAWAEPRTRKRGPWRGGSFGTAIG